MSVRPLQAGKEKYIPAHLSVPTIMKFCLFQVGITYDQVMIWSPQEMQLYLEFSFDLLFWNVGY